MIHKDPQDPKPYKAATGADTTPCLAQPQSPSPEAAPFQPSSQSLPLCPEIVLKTLVPVVPLLKTLRLFPIPCSHRLAFSSLWSSICGHAWLASLLPTPAACGTTQSCRPLVGNNLHLYLLYLCA